MPSDDAAPTSQLVYRYDAHSYDDREPISSRGDHFPRLTPAQQQVETLIRSTMPNGHNIRSTSLYTWENLEVARRVARLARKPLYELQIDVADIVHRGDVQHFSNAVDAINLGKNPREHVTKYCEGVEFISERVEILVTKAKVVRRIS
jgi:hypothetical protein